MLLLGWGLVADAPPAPPPYRVVSQDYLPGVRADVYLPDNVSAAPVVVLVPGGAWLTADRSGLRPLAKRLAAAGIVAVNATHRAAGSGARFPQPVSDIVSSIDFAVYRAAEAGITATFVVVLGHSSGAHLAALAALGGDTFRAASSPYPPARIDGLVGLAGPYDVLGVEDLAEPLFGRTPAQDPAMWRLGDPLTWVGQHARRSALHVLLAHGTADTLVSTTFTTQFAATLRANGYDVAVDLIDCATHQSIYGADVIGPRVIDWLANQSDDPPGHRSGSPGPRVVGHPARP